MTEERPASRVISGVEVVTIPIAEYAELLDCRRRLAVLEVDRGFISSKGKKSRIDRDPELAAYVANRLGRAEVKTIRAECIERFGADRTPSRSALYRYWDRLRSPTPAEAAICPEKTG